jgi:hypothetical protein
VSNERDCISEYFEAKGVSRGEFEALRRFGDYEELTDGTLMRMEGNKEFRIYCEDSGWLRGRNGGRGVIVTSGFCRVLSEAHDRVSVCYGPAKYREYARLPTLFHLHGSMTITSSVSVGRNPAFFRVGLLVLYPILSPQRDIKHLTDHLR